MKDLIAAVEHEHREGLVVLTHQVQKWIDAQPDPCAVMDGLLAQHPIGYLGTPEDIANGILFLASDQSKFMTGSELVMDGGFLL